MLVRLIPAALILLGLSVPCRAQDSPDLTAQQWREDVGALVNGLALNHRDAWNFVSRAEVMRLADEAVEQAGEAEDHEMLVALQRIAAAIGDGHTFVAASHLYSRYPVEVGWIEGDFYVVRSTPEYGHMLGDKLVAIDGVATAEAVEKALNLVPRNENRWYEFDAVAHLLTQAEPLAALGITRSPSGATFTLERPDGRRRQVRLAPDPVSERSGLVRVGGEGEPVAVEPERGLRLSMLNDVAYLDFASYDDLEADSAGIWAAIDDARPRALIIDFRKNGGGSLPAGRQYVVYPAWERAQLNRENCLFVLTGPATFSAAMTNVTDLRRETEATIVGLPTGARPNGYQENKWFTLPNSGLRVSAAQRRYRFGWPGETAVMPDVRAGQTIQDWRNGRDTALSVALANAQNCERRETSAR